MEKVFIVVRKVEYEGDTVLRVFANYKDAIAYADVLDAELDTDNLSTIFSHDVYEREVY